LLQSEPPDEWEDALPAEACSSGAGGLCVDAFRDMLATPSKLAWQLLSLRAQLPPHSRSRSRMCSKCVPRVTLLVAALRVAIMRPIAQEYKDLASMLAAKMRSTRAALFGSPETSAPRVAVAPSAQTSPPYLGPCYPRPSSACDLNLQLRHLQEARRALRPHSSHAARGRHSRACPVNR
jgi:hypothetical protein